MLHVTLDLGFVILTTNKTLGIEDGVLRVGVERVLRAVTNTTTTHEQHTTRGATQRTHSRSSSEKLTHDGVIR